MSDTPEPFDDDESGTELLRLWLDEDTLHCSLQLASEDPAFWGSVIADLTRHVAEALAEQQDGGDAAAILAQIRGAFDEDMSGSPEDAE